MILKGNRILGWDKGAESEISDLCSKAAFIYLVMPALRNFQLASVPEKELVLQYLLSYSVHNNFKPEMRMHLRNYFSSQEIIQFNRESIMLNMFV